MVTLICLFVTFAASMMYRRSDLLWVCGLIQSIAAFAMYFFFGILGYFYFERLNKERSPFPKIYSYILFGIAPFYLILGRLLSSNFGANGVLFALAVLGMPVSLWFAYSVNWSKVFRGKEQQAETPLKGLPSVGAVHAVDDPLTIRRCDKGLAEAKPLFCLVPAAGLEPAT